MKSSAMNRLINLISLDSSDFGEFYVCLCRSRVKKLCDGKVCTFSDFTTVDGQFYHILAYS